MRSILPVISVLGLLGAGGAVAWSVLSRPNDTTITREQADSFNLKTGPAPARAPSPLSPGETLRDAVAAAPPAPSSLVRPVRDPSLSFTAAPPPAPVKKITVISAKAESWARRSRFISGFAAKPLAYMLGRGPLGSARGLRAFLADPRKVDGYMNSALVRVTLNSTAVAKALLGNSVVIRAFLATPAMSDARSVRALLGSPMVRKMLDCPAIVEALGDPEVMRKLVADPQTVAWIAAHPAVLSAIAEAAPVLGGALTAKTR